MRTLHGALLAATCLIVGAKADPAISCDLKAPAAAHAGAGCETAWMDANLKLNDLLMVGTHNSYKQAIPDPVMALVRGQSPASADALDYAHGPLTGQLDQGARQLEIDILNDPEGGRYARPLVFALAGVALDAARTAALAKPGFKVMHIQDVDILSDCVLLTDCLGAVRSWSAAHPDHAPILPMFNLKRDKAALPGGTDALPFDDAAFDALDRDVRSVFPAESLITPGDVQGHYPTLREAVLAGNWPTLGASRGKVMFALDEDEAIARAYQGARRSLEGRVFFVNADETSPAAAYMTINDPVADAARIRAAVEAGFIVRTRADADTVEARRNDTARRDRALASGAQFVSTDYMSPDPRFPGGYQARLAGEAAAICNPVRARDKCAAAPVERMAAKAAAPTGKAYLTPENAPDGIGFLAPPPKPGSPRNVADRAIFSATRSLKGTARWQVATDDVTSDALTHFTCAIGRKLDAKAAPKLAVLLDTINTGVIVSPVKSHYQVERPYIGTDAPTCQDQTPHLNGNGDYPSGHTANGWMEALVLAELIPDRATQILARGRAFGESRVVCGVHSVSAVEAGYLAGAAAVAAMHALPQFRADMDEVRAELTDVLRKAPAADAAMCAREADALAVPPY